MADNAPMDAAAEGYLRALVDRTAGVLGDALVGVYVVNSGARDDYVTGRSDLDVAVVTAGSVPMATRRALVARLRHASLPCPAPRLELVAYPRGVVAAPGARPAFEVNLNTGPAIADHVALDPADEPPHWFVLDLAAASRAARRLLGPPPGEVFGAPARDAVIDALRASREWHAGEDTTGPNRVLNDCRTWMWLETGRWVSKTEAATWAVGAGGDRELIELAAARRRGETDADLPAERVAAFAAAVGERLARAGQVEAG